MLAGPTLGMTPTEVKDTQKLCQDVIDAIQLAKQRQKDARAAATAAQIQRQTTEAALRKTIARIRTAAAWSSAQGHSLGIQSTTPTPPPIESHKPKLTAHKSAGRVELCFTHKHMDGVHVYTRKKGEAAWRLLDRVRYSPAIDSQSPPPPARPKSANTASSPSTKTKRSANPATSSASPLVTDPTATPPRRQPLSPTSFCYGM